MGYRECSIVLDVCWGRKTSAVVALRMSNHPGSFGRLVWFVNCGENDRE